MSLPLIVSFYTPNYEKYVQRLQESMDSFGITNSMLEAIGEDRWHDVVVRKPQFILDCLNAIAGRS